MMNHSLGNLNIRRYLPFYTPCSETDHALAIYTPKGSRLLLEFSGNQDILAEAIQWIESKHFDWNELNQDCENTRSIARCTLQVLALTVGATEQLFWLVGIYNGPHPYQGHNTLQNIAVCLQEDSMQAESLVGMVDELTVRYEELNMLYGIDNIDENYKNCDEKQSLRRLLNNCIDFLNIDQAVIYLPDLGLNIHQSADEFSTHINSRKFINNIYQQIRPSLVNNPQPIVINHDYDNDLKGFRLRLPYKFIISPILNKSRKLHGIFVLLNQQEKPDFSNSDRKLSEILTAEVINILQARRDPLTCQLNRRGLAEQLDKTLKEIQIENQESFLLLINLDQFRVINDTAGQAAGDELLRQINSLIVNNLNKDDITGRLGADEFIVILKNCNQPQAEKIADTLRIMIKQFRFFYQDKLFDISACVGLVKLGADFNSFSEAVRAADLACRVAKEQGGNRLHIYAENDEDLLMHENQMQWVSQINIGLEENRFQIFRQTILPLQEQEDIPHYEILLRLQDRNGDILSPFHFIPAAERYNLMSKLDRWVVTTILEKLSQIKANQPQNLFSCSINLSGQSFCEEGFSDFIINKIKSTAVSPKLLCFEITETAAVSNLSQTIEFMNKIKKLGCQFSLDDFGTGMSSFTYLKNLPVDYLKIDGYFVKTMLENKVDKAMVNSIHQIGNVMGLKTIAEFVENEEILTSLKEMGIDYGQGYGIGKPEPF